LIDHSHRTLNIIKQNIGFSLLVKSAFVGLTFANKSTLWMAMLSDMGASFIVVSNGLRLLNNKAEATPQRQPILAVERTSIPILTDRLPTDERLPLLPRGQNYSPIYGGTTTAQSTGGIPPLGKKTCKDCKKDCKGKGKATDRTSVVLKDKDDIV
ncbi:MAG: hypothetical protein K2X39_06120, partial [Silvanigrellaceae bacterium]|nr:hypothetical protein [Silvanigrellaceae bacterium]